MILTKFIDIFFYFSSPHRSALRERNGRSSSENRHLPPIGPTKPAREFDRRRALSKYD